MLAKSEREPPMKMIRSEQSEVKRGARHCREGSCLAPTREGKPYCPDHIVQNPYAKKLSEELAAIAYERDIVQVRGSKGLPTNSVIATIISEMLAENGDMTPNELAKGMNIPLKEMPPILNALAKRKLVQMRQIDNDKRVYTLAKDDSAE